MCTTFRVNEGLFSLLKFELFIYLDTIRWDGEKQHFDPPFCITTIDEWTIKLTLIHPSIFYRWSGVGTWTCDSTECHFRIDFSLTLWNCRTLDLRFHGYHSYSPFRKRLRSETMLICYSGFIEIVSRSGRYIKAKVPHRCCSGTFDRIRIG